MHGPRTSDSYPDRHLDCEMDLEAAVLSIIDQGAVVGWSVADVTSALVALADNLLLADRANAETDRQIAEALARLGKPRGRE
jgi:phage tail tape-measure protein